MITYNRLYQLCWKMSNPMEYTLVIDGEENIVIFCNIHCKKLCFSFTFNTVSIIFLSALSHPLILVISCLGNEGLYRSVAMLLNREPFVSDSGDCQRIWGGEKGSQLVSGNSWIVKGVIYCGVSATDWKVNTCTTNEEIIFCCHDNTKNASNS